MKSVVEMEKTIETSIDEQHCKFRTSLSFEEYGMGEIVSK